MLDTSTHLPATEASDVAEVIAALQTARELWTKGQALESVRWIQRAAENAEEAGNDLRAVSLARAAADLRAEVNVHSEPPGPVTEATALAPYDEFTESTIVDSPASSLARVTAQNNVQIAELHPSSPPATKPAAVSTPVTAAPPPPPPPPLAPPAAAATLAAAPAPSAVVVPTTTALAPAAVVPPVAPPPVAAPAVAAVAPPEAASTATATASVTPATPMVRSVIAAQYQALRVCVIGAGAGASELSVRVLNEGEAAPAGVTEALLVALDPRTKLL